MSKAPMSDAETPCEATLGALPRAVTGFIVALLLSLSWLILLGASTAAVADEGATGGARELWTKRHAHHGYCGLQVLEFCPEADDAGAVTCLRARRADLFPECMASLIQLGVLSAPPTRSPTPAVLYGSAPVKAAPVKAKSVNGDQAKGDAAKGAPANGAK